MRRIHLFEIVTRPTKKEPILLQKTTDPWLIVLLLTVTVSCSPPALSTSTNHHPTEKHPLVPALVVSISEEYANINTDISKKRLASIGIEVGSRFTAHFENQKIKALLGKDYSDVSRGDWIALIEEDDTLQLAISFGNAATKIGCAAGDTLYIESPTANE
jgi:S-adenosylmethionine hydrolase